jgi:hypothetical protein
MTTPQVPPAPRLDAFIGDDTKRPPRKDTDVNTQLPEPKTALPVGKEEAAATKKADIYEGMTEDLAPIENYQKFLTELSIDPDEAANIVDDLVSKGYYEEEVTITKKLTAMLRTRTHADTLRLQRHIEITRPIFNDSMTEVQIRFNLAGSLVRFGSTLFEFPTEKTQVNEAEAMFDKRLSAIERMPFALLVNLSNKLARFDRKIAAIMREGVAENF